jgi:peptide chain release factor 2
MLMGSLQRLENGPRPEYDPRVCSASAGPPAPSSADSSGNRPVEAVAAPRLLSIPPRPPLSEIAMYAEVIEKLKALKERTHRLKDTLKVEESEKRLLVLEGSMAEQGFWDKRNAEKAQEVIAEKKRLSGEIDPVNELVRATDDLVELAELAQGEGEGSHLAEIQAEAERLEARLDRLELSSTLNGRQDPADAFLSAHAGAGGTESCDWASMLFRMYSRWADRNGFKCAIVDSVAGEETGLRNITVSIKGDYAYGYLKSEAGVHRLVRISPFDAKKRRHTSFASVDVVPDSGEAAKIEVKEADLKFDTFRAGGAGGQHVNVTDSAVRVTHLPSGIIVQCQNERSQHSNRATALKLLKARLARIDEEKREAEIAKQYGEKPEIAFGSQIRSYVLHPYKMVKDHRTGFETGKAEAVLDGDLQLFIEAYLRWKRKGSPKVTGGEPDSV